MDRDDELKDYFQSRPPQEEFSFDQAGWEKMHAALLAERKTKRRRLIIYLNFLLLVLGTGIIYRVNDATKTNVEKSSLASTIHKPTGQRKTQQPIIKKEERSISNIKHPTPSPTLKIPVSHKNDLITDQIIKPTEEKLSPGNAFANKDFTAGKVEISLKRIFENQTTRAENTNETLIEMKDGEPLNSETPLADQNNTKTNSVLNEPLSKENISEFLPGKTIKIPEHPDTLLTLIFLQTPELSTSAPLPVKDSLKSKLNPEKRLSFVVGTDYLMGWKNAGITEANGFNPIIGLDYFNILNNKTGVSIGLQYTTINNLKNTDHTSTATRVKFGEEVDVTTISARKMYYLLMPLKLHYALNGKNSFGVGYTFGYLLDVKSQVKTYTENKDNEQVSTAMGYSKGFSNFDGQLAFCYQRTFLKKFYAGAEFFYGTKDLKLNSVYNSNAFERSVGFKLTLNYIFLKK